MEKYKGSRVKRGNDFEDLNSKQRVLVDMIAILISHESAVDIFTAAFSRLDFCKLFPVCRIESYFNRTCKFWKKKYRDILLIKHVNSSPQNMPYYSFMAKSTSLASGASHAARLVRPAGLGWPRCCCTVALLLAQPVLPAKTVPWIILVHGGWPF